MIGSGFAGGASAAGGSGMLAALGGPLGIGLTAASMLSGIMGEKKLAPQAPAYDGGDGSLLDNSFLPEETDVDPLAAILSQYFQPSETDTIGQEVAALPLPVDTPEVQAAPDAGTLDWFKNATNENLANTPDEVPSFLGGLGDMAGGFFGNMDENLQSPSKQLGLGLLGQVDPRLGYAGLLSMGLLGKNKLFGK